MKKESKVVVFPELNKVKHVLWDVQGNFRDDKPKLNTRLKDLQPKGQNRLLDQLEQLKKSPLSGRFPEGLRTDMDELRHAMTQVESFLGDANSRRALKSGRMDTTLNKLYAPVLDDNLAAIGTLSEELKTMSYGAKAIEAFHIFQTRINLLEITISNLFDTLDLRVGVANPDSALNQLFQNLRAGLAPLNERDEMAAVFELLANWKDRWADKPFFAEQLAGVLPLAVVKLERQKNLENYRVGDVVASLKGLGGKLTEVKLARGRLPQGLQLDQTTFQLVVSNPGALFEGTFGDLEFDVKNEFGLSSRVILDDLEFGSDVEAYYVMEPVKPVADYVAGDLLAAPVDPDGEVIFAQLTGGTFPKGVRLNLANGEIRIADPAKLNPGTYDLQVLTGDETGGETSHRISLSIGNQGTSAGGSTTSTTDPTLDSRTKG